MRNTFAKIIIGIVNILNICVFALFVNILWNEFNKLPTSSVETEEFQTEISEYQDTTEKEIKVPEIIENPFEQLRDENDYKKEEINYNNVTVNKYFYNQLEEYSKTIYKALESNKENMKTGTYKVDLGNSLSILLDQENGHDLLGQYYQSAIEAYTYDNPDVFYLNPNKMYLNIETTTTRNTITHYVYINCGNEKNYLIDEFSSKEQIDEAIGKIENTKKEILKNKKKNVYDNIKMVHDYLVENIQYDTTLKKENIYNIYGAMVNKECVCEGYARSFKYIMDSMGIECTLVIGKGTNSEGKTENHAWNYVQIDGYWYALDITWDDPISRTGFVSEISKYRYFLKGSNDMVKDHIPNGQFTKDGKVFSYPPLSTENYE